MKLSCDNGLQPGVHMVEWLRLPMPNETSPKQRPDRRAWPFNLRIVVQSITNHWDPTHSLSAFLPLHAPTKNRVGPAWFTVTSNYDITKVAPAEDLPKLNPVFTSVDQVKNGKMEITEVML